MLCCISESSRHRLRCVVSGRVGGQVLDADRTIFESISEFILIRLKVQRFSLFPGQPFILSNGQAEAPRSAAQPQLILTTPQ